MTLRRDDMMAQQRTTYLQFLRISRRAGVPFGLLMGLFLGGLVRWRVGVAYGLLSIVVFSAGLAAFLFYNSCRTREVPVE